jgi:thiamine transport system substrate-binding protein
MKHFSIFLVFVFLGLFVALYVRQHQDPNHDSRPVLRVYAQSSFIKQWGPGPWLKEIFESQCDCRVEYHDASDAAALVQRVKSEPQNQAADLVLGFDQYDLELAQKGLEWKPIKVDADSFEESIRPLLSRSNFVPYDWGVLSFLGHKSEMTKLPQNLDDLLAAEYTQTLSVQDPRTSSPGLQLLLWIIQVRGEEDGFAYLQKLQNQVKIWGPNWSTSFGLFQKRQAKLTFSYITSTIALQKEDVLTDVIALPFSEGHPVQYEFLGIPSTCQHCDLAEKFAGLIFSKEGQHSVMEKNYMFPVIKGVIAGSGFDKVPEFKTIDMTIIPNQAERERILKKWSQMRRSE